MDVVSDDVCMHMRYTILITCKSGTPGALFLALTPPRRRFLFD